MCNKRDNVWDSLFAFLRQIKPLLKRVFSKRKEFASMGSKFFPFRVDPFSEAAQSILTELPPMKMYAPYLESALLNIQPYRQAEPNKTKSVFRPTFPGVTKQFFFHAFKKKHIKIKKTYKNRCYWDKLFRLKFRQVVSRQCELRSNCSYRSSLIRVRIVCYPINTFETVKGLSNRPVKFYVNYGFVQICLEIMVKFYIKKKCKKKEIPSYFTYFFSMLP